MKGLNRNFARSHRQILLHGACPIFPQKGQRDFMHLRWGCRSGRLGVMIALIILCFVPGLVERTVASHGLFQSSTGIYRIPYSDGTTVGVSRDHHDHSPATDRIDMSAGSGTQIVAAASGIIRGMVDSHGDSNGNGNGLDINNAPYPSTVAGADDSTEQSCADDLDDEGNVILDSVVPGRCSNYNNYVWIEHPNGEWTKYTHFQTGSVTANGWAVGVPIMAGEVLGLEGDVGRAGGSHLHFEVGLPDQPVPAQPFSTNGGFMVPNFGVNLAPRVCDIDNNLYASGESYDANPCDNELPIANAGGSYTVDEGSTVQLDGTLSSDPDGNPLTYLWAPDTNLDDATLAEPTYAGIDDVVDALTLTVFDQVEALSASDSTTVTVQNVNPTVSLNAIPSASENTAIQLNWSVADPGWQDVLTATVNWDDGQGIQALVGTAENTSPDATLSGSVPHVYGDDGVYTIQVCAADDDGGASCANVIATITNTNPTAVLAEDLYFAHAGEDVVVTGQSTDPGSDDLSAVWDWDINDVDPAQSVEISLVNDPATEPVLANSPSIQPRDVDWSATHAYPQACLYDLNFTVGDDDGGTVADTAVVIVSGNDPQLRGSGWWMNQFRPNPPNDFTPGQLDCYLAIVSQLSGVFVEVRGPLSSRADAVTILFVKGNNGSAEELFDEQLLAAWLNFANGAYDLDTPVDTDGDGINDSTFEAAVQLAEAVRLDLTASREDLLAQKNILERLVTVSN